jgi:probable DNA metabolism protein
VFREREEENAMYAVTIDHNFAAWRDAARALLAAEVPPELVQWSATETLLGQTPPATGTSRYRVPKDFLKLAERIACHRDREKWPLLYRVLWRLTHGQPHLLELEIDDDTRRLRMMDKEIGRDIHKMHAFGRFRKVQGDAGDHFIAWHRPDHLIVRPAAEFFRKRFGGMRWTILTPDDSVTWDGHELAFGPGVPRSAAPADDELEDFWRTYYAATFNPARIKLKAMRQHMPLKHWATLPETELFGQLMHDAPARVETMVRTAREQPPMTARPYIPATLELPVLREAVKRCQGCNLHCFATQPVFGEGPATARCMVVGEQPGDSEDLAGRPFVGPAGQLLDDALREAGLGRDELYLTNAVKHFKYEQGGKRRIHARASAREIAACRPWLEAEIALVQPKMIVCLGNTALQTLLGGNYRVGQWRGRVITDSPHAPWLLATVHPSFLLRIPDEPRRQREQAAFIDDLRRVAHTFRHLTPSANAR